ncbi:hypothetical protein FRC14_006336 [Serendipita sp. 396]|nr:hypothetical protein FRC14_006336 [Serendipita sp. 396]KAG8787319.1 hypothetical protein FRC15_009517 [Serendipita sp. 397]KAG8802449.1 hypothetical protein FRC16_009638 [Serendipita sp. 398]KAG8825947.1 hypothetical protein FRC19_010124 [Serendipita sp. 401]KAG8838115.1 hypothetical protein FRC18_006148 [Serendipita sp. 400]KAG8872008.1 hypothetical protein FRC20_009907 [Serendipita sp. 405]KAG9056714.1 hypothetical protein FS842_009806 [Serendipita sp. 407]
MALLRQVLEFARNANQRRDYASLAMVFVLPSETSFNELVVEVQRLPEAALDREVATLQINDGQEFAEVLRRYLRFLRIYATQDWGNMARSMIEIIKSCASILKPKQTENRQVESIAWFMPSLKKLCLSAIAICTVADEKNPRALTRGNAFAELRSLLGISNLRPDKDKHTAVLFLAGQIVRVSLQLDVQGALAHTLRQISGVVSQMELAPQADRLRFCYWAGRWHLLEHRVGVAYPLLKTAFSICPNRMMKHKRSIFRQLLGAAIPLGIFPHPTLLKAFGLHTYFVPLIRAMKAGDAIALALAIDSQEPRDWFRRYGLHTVLKEKCCIVVWRNLVYKTYTFLEENYNGRSVDSIPFSLLGRVFRLSYDVDDGWDQLRIQSVIMSLVSQGYIIGRVEGFQSLSLRPNGTRRERFPNFSSVRQTYQVQAIWGVNLK